MAGVSGSLDVNQAPQYGDKTALDNVRKGMTYTPMTGNPVPAPGPGRPPTGQPQPQGQPQGQPQQPQEQPFVPDEHLSLMDQVAQAYRTKVFWDNVLKNYPSEWSRLYASDASFTYKQLAEQLRNSTPYFE